MFCTKDARPFVPSGRVGWQHHPGTTMPPNDKTFQSEPSQLNIHLFQKFNLNEAINEGWRMQKSGSSLEEGDEELYFRDNVVIWSRTSTHSSHILRCYMVDSPVIEALWCSFIMATDRDFKKSPSHETPAYLQTCVCVLEEGKTSFFCTNGKDYVSSLPIPVRRVWPMKFGLLFERCTTDNEATKTCNNQEMMKLPVLFSLIHPLDELVPVISCTSGVNSAISFVNDPNLEVVFSDASCNFVVTFNHHCKRHSVWNLRWATTEELRSLVGGPAEMSLSLISSEVSRHGLPFFTAEEPFKHNHNRPDRPSLTSLDLSHFPSINSKASTPSFSLSRLSTPIPSLVLGYAHSPHVILPNLGYNHYGNRKMATPPHAIYSPFDCQSTAVNHSLPETSTLVEPCQNLSPEICIESLWTEGASGRDSEKATKAFLTEDFGGQKFLCLLLSCKLKCIRYNETLRKNLWVFSTTSHIPAKQAVPLASIQMLLVLDTKNVLTLYSGLHKMTCINMASQTPRCTTLPHQFGDFGPTTSSRPNSSLDARPEDAEFATGLSPVLASRLSRGLNSSQVTCLRDPVNNRFTIENSDGTMSRVQMPPFLFSSIVEGCMQAMRAVLSRDALMSLCIKWYLLRNTPGSAGTLQEWQLFQSCVSSLLGCKNLLMEQNSSSFNSPEDCKKARLSTEGSDKDWLEMLASVDLKAFKKAHGVSFDLSQEIDRLKIPPTSDKSQSGGSEEDKAVQMDTKAPLYGHAYSIFLALHLYYQNTKLDTSQEENGKELATYLHHFSIDLGLPAYTDFYCRDNPILFAKSTSCNAMTLFQDLPKPPHFPGVPPCIYTYLTHLINHSHPPRPFPFIPTVTLAIKHIVMTFAYEFADLRSLGEIDWRDYLVSITPTASSNEHHDKTYENLGRYSAIVQLASQNSHIEKYLPLAFRLPLIHSIHRCRSNPPFNWTPSAYTLIGREDLAKQSRVKMGGGIDDSGCGMKKSVESNNDGVRSRNKQVKKNLDSSNGGDVGTTNDKKKSVDDGMANLDSELLKLRFSKDLRVNEIRKMLRSSAAIKVAIPQRPGISDHDFIEEQEKYLLCVSIRTMALSVGRGILTMGTYLTVPTEALPIPKLCLSGRVPPRNNIIEITHIDTPSNLLEWPQFHNGVASGLRITNKIQLESSWILFNKLKSDKLSNEHAGFLMGQGLNGQLSNLATLNVHDYLIKGNEMISIGLLLGMAADKRGSMDTVTIRTLSIHVPAFLPPTSTELDVPHNVQVASILGVGLVYQATGNKHISDVLLNEIGRPPGPEMENSFDRESYSLAAGFALGNVKLAKGCELTGFSAKELSDQLFYYMNGTKSREFSHRYRGRLKVGSCQIKDADCVNVDVTGPSAVVALSLIFFNSMNTSVSEWLVAPDTPTLLESVKPDLLLLRTVGYGLIMWQDVQPTLDWILSNVPKIIRECVLERVQEGAEHDANVDVEHMSQSYVNIVTGACMAVALKHAGTADSAALNCLNHYFSLLLKWQKDASRLEVVGRYTLEQCLCTLLLNMAMVMSGTGHLGVLRKCRFMRSRISPHVPYGSHMVVGMATGLLVFGGGRYTLSTRPDAIAAMLCAFYPKYPVHSDENRFHLQAFRHLYCLAGERRVLLPRDVCDNKVCFLDVDIVFKDGSSRKFTAPSLLPELSTLSQVHIKGQKYWDVSFKQGVNLDALEAILSDDGNLYVKQKMAPHITNTHNLTRSSRINNFFKLKQLSRTPPSQSYLTHLCRLLPDSDEDHLSSLWSSMLHSFLILLHDMPTIQVDLHQMLLSGVRGLEHKESGANFLRQFCLVMAMHKRLLERRKEEGGMRKREGNKDVGGRSKMGGGGGGITDYKEGIMNDGVEFKDHEGRMVGGELGEGLSNGNGRREKWTFVLQHEVVMSLHRHAEAVITSITSQADFIPVLKTYLKSSSFSSSSSPSSSTSSSSSASSPSHSTSLSYFLIWHGFPYPSPLHNFHDKGFIPMHRHLSKHGLPTSLVKTLHKTYQ